MRIITMALAGIALSLGTAGQAEDWRATAFSDTAVMFVDVDSIVRSGSYTRGRITTVLQPDPSGERDWIRSVYLREVNCSSSEVRTLRSQFYYAGGEMVEDSSDASDWTPIREGTMLWGVTSAICGTREIDAERVRDPEEWSANYFSGDYEGW